MVATTCVCRDCRSHHADSSAIALTVATKASAIDADVCSPARNNKPIAALIDNAANPLPIRRSALTPRAPRQGQRANPIKVFWATSPTA